MARPKPHQAQVSPFPSELSLTVHQAWRVAVVARRQRHFEVLLWSLGGPGRLRGLVRIWRCTSLTQAHALQAELAAALEAMPAHWSMPEVLQGLPRRPKAWSA